MKKFVYLLLAAVMSFSVFGAVGCKPKTPDDSENVLEVFCTDKGYGTKWCSDLMDLFQQQDWVKDKYPNLIFSTWDTVDRPRQVIVSDMTVIKYSWFFFELTMYFDVFTKEILTWHVAERRGHRDQYIDGLNDVINLLKGTDEPTVLHTDQGSVYASLAYNELIKDTLIVRSMSRAGKPTDNPVNESLNGWIKEELFIDFKIETCNSREEFEEALDAYVDYYNEKRPCYAIGYDTPNNYRKRFYKGELPRKDTFGKREANATPKFVTERKKMAGNEKNKE